jgi:hypothetical protein
MSRLLNGAMRGRGSNGALTKHRTLKVDLAIRATAWLSHRSIIRAYDWGWFPIDFLMAVTVTKSTMPLCARVNAGLSFLTVVVALSSGCAPSARGGSDLTGRAVASTQERDQVKVTVVDAHRLARIGTISLATLGFGADAIEFAGREKRWSKQFRDIVSEELAMELAGSSVGNATALKSVGDGLADSVQGSNPREDARLELRIVRAQERRGGQLGADHGAVASIGLVLRDAQTRAAVWEGNYFYKDVALTDNLLGYGSTVGGKSSEGWVNLDEAVYTGMRAALKRLERDRIAAFSRGS